jgi:hypothetical protein
MKTLKKIAFSLAATGLLVVGVPGAAHAATGLFLKNDTDPSGVCRFYAVNDVTPNGLFGGPFVWNGAAALDFVAPVNALPPDTYTVSCELRVNGAGQGTVVGPDTGTSVLTDQSRLSFTAAPGDRVTICAHVQRGTNPETVSCGEGVTSEISGLVDEFLCFGVLDRLAPLVNSLGLPQVIRIDPVTDDLYVLNQLIIDCP